MNEFRWSDYINDTVVISLKERDDRRELLDMRLRRVDLGNGDTLKDYARYFDAHDTTVVRDIPKNVVDRYYDFDFHYEVDPRDTLEQYYNQGRVVESTDVEMAISYSHYSVWKHIVDNKVPATLIMEDDVLFRFGLLGKLRTSLMEDLPKDYDLLYLSYDTTNASDGEKYKRYLYKINFGLWWMSAYILTYEGAKKLMEGLPITGPVDVWINHQFKNMSVFSMDEPIITQTYETPSSNDWSFANNYYRSVTNK